MSTPGDGRTYRFRCRRPHGRATPSHHRSDSLVRSSTRLRPVLDPSPTSSTPDRRRTQRRSTHAALSLSTRHTSSAVARASRAAKRARERVRGMSESPQATRESAGEGVAVTGARVSCGRIHARSTDLYERIGPEVAVSRVRVSQIISVTQSSATYRIGPGGCGGNWCPAVADHLGHAIITNVQNRPGRGWR